MSTALAVHVLHAPAKLCATIVGDDGAMCRQASRLMTDSGFDLTMSADRTGLKAGSDPERLVILASREIDTSRVQAVKAIAEELPDARILAVMPTESRSALLRRTLVAGASGIVLEADLERALVVSARALLLGQMSVPTRLARQIAPKPLSHREKQIVALVVRGLTNREIANELYLAESTIKTHLSSAFRKLDARSRAEAVARIQDPENGYGIAILASIDQPA
jgi:DNA-binding NarL/FixJ family response regulator